MRDCQIFFARSSSLVALECLRNATFVVGRVFSGGNDAQRDGGDGGAAKARRGLGKQRTRDKGQGVRDKGQGPGSKGQGARAREQGPGVGDRGSGAKDEDQGLKTGIGGVEARGRGANRGGFGTGRARRRGGLLGKVAGVLEERSPGCTRKDRLGHEVACRLRGRRRN